MARQFFGKVKHDRTCPSCKGPLHNRRNPSIPLCEMCEAKMCSVCGKISVNGVRVSTDGFPFCPKHWNSWMRFKVGRLNLDWDSDRNFKEWVANRARHLENRLGIGLEANAPGIESDLNSDNAEAVEAAINKLADMVTRGIKLPGTDSEE